MDDPDRQSTATVDLDGLLPSGRSSRKYVYVVVLNGQLAGALYRLGEVETTVGRDDVCDITIADDGISRVHAKLIRRSPTRIELRDLGSTNGTFVGSERVTSSMLGDGDRFSVAATILKIYFGDELEESLQRGLYESSTRDGLTGLHNRRHFDEQLASELSFATRHGTPLSLVMIDLDHFKRINDEFGHPAGDDVLRDVAEAMQNTTRAEDVVARYGGEEFAVIARQTSTEQAFRIAERIRGVVASRVVRSGDHELRVTLSAGVACFVGTDAIEPSELVAAADAALYQAKERGRNQVVTSETLVG